MVDRGYMVEKPPGPGTLKVYFDQAVFPVLINAAGAVEAVVERVVVRTRERPATTLGMALAVGCGVGLLGRRR